MKSKSAGFFFFHSLSKTTQVYKKQGKEQQTFHSHYSMSNNKAKEVRLTSSDGSILQNDAVVDEADVLGWGWGSRPLAAQQVKDFGGQHCVLTVLDKLTQVRQT
jgi:hypothetical protein